MIDGQQHFKGQLEGELVICVFRKHWISILPTLVSMPGILVVLFLIFANLPLLVSQGHWMAYLMVFALGALHAVIHRQFLTVFYYYLNTVIVTDRRVVLIDKSVFFKDSKTSIDLVNVQDIQKHQVGIFQNFLNYGSLTFTLSGSGGPSVIDLVPRPEYQYKKIHEVKAAVASLTAASAPTLPLSPWVIGSEQESFHAKMAG